MSSGGEKVTLTLTWQEWRNAAAACSDAARKVYGPDDAPSTHRLAAEFYRAAGYPVLAAEEEGLANE